MKKFTCFDIRTGKRVKKTGQEIQTMVMQIVNEGGRKTKEGSKTVVFDRTNTRILEIT